MATLVGAVESDGDSLNKIDELTNDSDPALLSQSLNENESEPDSLNNIENGAFDASENPVLKENGSKNVSHIERSSVKLEEKGLNERNNLAQVENESNNHTEREPMSMVEVHMEEESLEDETENANQMESDPMSLLQIEMEPEDYDETDQMDDIKTEPETNTHVKTEDETTGNTGSVGELDVFGQRYFL